MSAEFETASAITPLGDGRFSAQIPPGWDIVGNVNGGYMMAIAARAAAEVSGRSAPVTVTAHFLAPGHEGPVGATAEVLKAGKRYSTVSAALTTDRPLLVALGTFRDAGEPPEKDLVRLDGAPPDMPAPEDCIKVEPTDTFPPPFVGRIDLRIHPDNAVFATGTDAVVRGWVRLKDEEPVDEIALLMLADALPPAVFFIDVPVGWVPTVELTIHVRRRPVPGWLRSVFRTRFISDGMLEEDGELWDESGALVAQSRQLALMPRG